MITVDNLPKVLKELGYTGKNGIYTKHFEASESDITVDFNKKAIKYPDELEYGRSTTLNFSQKENFVVLECVTRLLSQGYKPKHLYLEAPVPGGHKDENAGYSDILIKDNNGTPYLIIECKTTDEKDDEFSKAWSKTKKSGGQLFNYFNTFRQAKYLVLYASDYTDKITPVYYVISLIDNEEYLKTNPKLKSFKSVRDENGAYTEYFDVWKNTYQQDFSVNGVMEKEIKPFNVGSKKLTADDLLEIDAVSMKKKYNEYATILRQYNVSGKENAFDKLVNLFLAKIIDETYNVKELKCNWQGAAYDNYFALHDRLHELYKRGMEEFFGDEITYVENQKIEEAFKFISSKKDEAKDTIFAYIRELKYFNNNPFAILDVHNQELFRQNAIILKDIVKMLQNVKLKSDKQNQFLGDLFEGFLDQGVKQSEGQFFTPMPIVRFLISSLPLEKILNTEGNIPKVIDYACGAGHFLTEYASQIRPYIEKGTDIQEYYKEIIGIEKEYRLTKVSQVSAYMYGQDGIKIRYKDALSKEIDGVKNNTFSVLVANPPYSVKGFLETLSDEDKNEFELTAKVPDITKNNAIETFFVEKAKHLLKENGVAAIILPSSILSNGGIYASCREIILKYFDIISIANFGTGTFGKTGTNTAVFFMRRRSAKPDMASHFANRVEAWFSANFDDDAVYHDGDLLKLYCETIGVPLDDYKTLLSGSPNDSLFETDIFKEYVATFDFNSKSQIAGLNENAKEIKNKIKNRAKTKTFKKLDKAEQEKEKRDAFIAFLREIEQEKLYYFLLVSHNAEDIIIVNSPSDSDANKKYLGYEWSSTKGKEGIQYLNAKTSSTANNDEEDDDVISQIRGIDGIKTPLFSPDNLFDETKINTLIRKNFNGEEPEIPEDLEDYVSKCPLVNMIDFKSVGFSKTIIAVKSSYMPNKRQFSVKLDTYVDVNLQMIDPTKMPNKTFQYVDIGSVNNVLNTIDYSKKIKGSEAPSRARRVAQEGNVAISTVRPNLKSFAMVSNMPDDTVFSTGIAILSSKDETILSNKFLYRSFLDDPVLMEQMCTKMGKGEYPSINNNDIANFYILVPPIDIQHQIVSEFESAEYKIAENKNLISQCDEEIKAKFVELFGHTVRDRKFSFLCLDDTKKGYKYQTSEYMKTGDIPIIDQGNKAIAGYTKLDEHKPPYNNLPCIVFGDHSENFKYVTKKFYLGADGTKIIVPKDRNILNPIFLYSMLKNEYSPTGKYARHFKNLKRLELFLPPIDLQNQFAEFAEQKEQEKAEAEERIKQLEAEREKLIEKYFK